MNVISASCTRGELSLRSGVGVHVEAEATIAASILATAGPTNAADVRISAAVGPGQRRLQGPVVGSRDEVDGARLDHDGLRGSPADPEPRHRLAELGRGGHVEVTREPQLDDSTAAPDRQIEDARSKPRSRGSRSHDPIQRRRP
jgi:hypothetical protein